MKAWTEALASSRQVHLQRLRLRRRLHQRRQRLGEDISIISTVFSIKSHLKLLKIT